MKLYKEYITILKHWIKFHTAIPKESGKALNVSNKDIIGAIVKLKDDPKGIEYEVIASGPISRGPMRQYPPSISFLVREPVGGYEKMYYYYHWFRKDSLIFIR